MSTGVACPVPILQFFNNAGQPNVNGSILTQVGGVNTPTYQDSALATPLPNPIPLNSRGEVSNATGLSCQLFLTPNVAYTFTVFDANGNQLNQAQYVDGVQVALTQSSIGAALYPQTANEALASVTPTYYQYPEGNVLRYGADSTGTYSSFGAIQQAVKVACYGANSSGVGNHAFIYFPHGTYIIDQTNAFTNPLGSTGNVQRGILVYGDGMMSSILQLSGAASTLWLINGPSNEQQYISMVWKDLAIQGDPVGGPAGLSNGFSMYLSQNMMFYRIWFTTLGTAYQDSGSQAGDGVKFFGCRFNYIYTRVLALNNLQFLNTELFGCTIELIYGDVFQVNTGGGGALRVYGGSIIMVNSGTQRWLLNIYAGASLGNNNNTYYISGVQTQRQLNNGLVYCGFYGGAAPKVLFDDFNDTATGFAQLVVNIAQCHVVFRNSVLTQNSGDTFQVSGPASGGGDIYGDPGSIIFDQTEVNYGIASLCSCVADSGDSIVWGSISARDCFNSNYNNGASRYARYAIDFDQNWQNSGYAGSGLPRLKRAQFKPQARQWPDSSVVWTLNMPAGAKIVRVTLYRTGGTGGTAYTLQLGDSANATRYGSSTAGTTGTAQTYVLDYLDTPASWIDVTGIVGSGINQIQLSASTTASGQTAVGAGGYAFLEYY